MNNIGIVFPGFGVQFTGMGEETCKNYPSVKNRIEEASDTLGIDLMSLALNGKLSEISRIEVSWPLIFTICVGLYDAYLLEVGLKPQMMAGHSLGEYTALTCAGGLEFSDAVQLLKYRASIIQALPEKEKGAFSIIDNVSTYYLGKLLKLSSINELYISCFNTNEQHAVSGELSKVMELEKVVREHGGTATPVLGYPAIHSPVLNSIIPQFKEKLEEITFHETNVPVYSNVDFSPYKTAKEIKDKLALQLINSVCWHQTIATMIKNGANTVLEIGPRAYLTNLKENTFGAEYISFTSNFSRLKKIFATEINYEKYRVLHGSITCFAGLPNKVKVSKDEREKLREHYNRLMRISEDLNNGNKVLLSNAEVQKIKQETRKGLIIKGYESENINRLIKAYE